MIFNQINKLICLYINLLIKNIQYLDLRNNIIIDFYNRVDQKLNKNNMNTIILSEL